MGRLLEPHDREVKNGCAGGVRGRDGSEVAAGQTGDVESQARQLHKDGHGAEAKGGKSTGEVRDGLEAATVKSGGLRGLGSSSVADHHAHDEVMKTLSVS